MVTKIRTKRRVPRSLYWLLIVVAVVVIVHVGLDRLYGYKLHDAIGFGATYAKNMWLEIATRYLGGIVYLFLALFAARPLAEVLPTAAYRGVQVLFGVLGWVIGFGMWSIDPTVWYLFLHHASFHHADPLLHFDESFYIYSLPVIEGLVGRIVGTLALWLIVRLISLVGSFAQQQMSISRPGFASLIRRQARVMLILLASILLGFTVMSYLNRFEIVLSSGNGSFVYGPDFVTTHLTLPVFSWLHIAMLLLAAIAVFWQAFHLDGIFPERDGLVIPTWRSFRRPIYALGLYVASLVLSGIVGGLVNGLYVHPNQNTVELPYIRNTIDETRWALGIQNVQTTPFKPQMNLTTTDLQQHQDALSNVRVNDQGQTKAIYNQLQSFKNYFTFDNTAVDRYNNKEVYISTRELDVSKLPVQTWVNQTLVYTHGYGVAASPVNQFDSQGLPILWAKNTPVTTAPQLPKITRPQIYFGMMNNDVIAPSKQTEFDYPVGSSDHSSHYQGGYGLPVRGNRLLLTIEQGNLKYYTSDQITAKSQFLFDRNIYQRVEDIAPFLTYDKDAYPFIDSAGHIEWILDAYTQSPNVPYAQKYMNTAYIRNSVKVVVDAYTGKTTFYVVNKSDPMVKSLAAVYPGLFTYNIPADVKAHFRYPTDLFSAQSQALTRYHMNNPSAFYNQDDLWDVAREIYNQNQTTTRSPVYQMIQMPNQTAPQFVLSELFTPHTKDNLNGWLIADNSPSDYGKLTLYQFPQSNLIFGPMQAENQIDSNPSISQQLSLWNQQGSHVVRGNLLLIPFGNSLVYVEPVYLVANRNNSLPQLERVIVDYNEQVYINTSLGAAMQDVIKGVTAGHNRNLANGQSGQSGQTGAGQSGQAGSSQSGQGTGQGQGGNTTGGSTGGGVTGVTNADLSKLTAAQLVSRANQLFTAYENDTAAGQLDKAGADLKQLHDVLAALQAKDAQSGVASNGTGK